MHKSKLKTTWFLFNVMLSFVSVAALMYFTYVFLNRITDHKATTSVVVILSLVGVIYAYAIFRAIANYYRGVTLECQIDEISKFIPQKPTIWFLILLPLLLPLFAYIYSFLLTLLVSLASIPFGVLSEKSARMIARSVSIVALLFSVGTSIGLWKRVKKTMRSSEKQ